MKKIKEFLSFINDSKARYLERYCRFIQSRRESVGEYHESHHILPVSIFPELKTEKWNIVKLSAREHFIAHYLLFKAFPKNRKLIHAFWCMSIFIKHGRSYKISGRIYEEIRTAYANNMKGAGNPFYGKKHTDETRAKWEVSRRGANNCFYGKHHSDETKEKISNTKKAQNLLNPIQLSEQHRMAIAKGNTGQKKAQVFCEFCQKLINGPTNYKRWHGEKCKSFKSTSNADSWLE